MSYPPIALTIAGSDSGGGAGIQADLKTFSALGVYGASVITALTAQNTCGVAGIYEVSPEFIVQQIDTVASDLDVDAAKIGMLHRSEIIESVANSLNKHEIGHIVLDPVMVAKSGDPLLQDEAIEALKSILIPMASIITPNIPEAARLLRRKPAYIESNMHDAAQRLLSLGCGSVLLKGGHNSSASESTDIFHDGNNAIALTYPRFTTGNTHGTGCTLSSAVCAFLARKRGLNLSVELAKQFISEAIEDADKLNIGSGHGPVHHFHRFWDQESTQ
ncbi:MAG: bifunctional hydroxymethylpyrimidine kinase/phosphomethylpyrimidine kinase [Gammaproteobacteria bacterium]|nr:bifunctional hydroxymethylpyrimidine kinase/phosphomethylpyrimidine kinase [Gammaproteobacteria bacterium]